MRQLNPKQFNETLVSRKSDKIINVFLLPSSSFYILTVAIALILFFIFWAVLQETGDKSPWIYSGIFASLIIISAVLLREIILRDARIRNFPDGTLYSKNFRKETVRRRNADGSRFSLQNNSSFLKLIEKKARAARHSRVFPEKHLEVFELCNEYLKLTERELRNSKLGTTKWGAFKNGRKRVKEIHKYHLISWAAVESRRLTKEAGSGSNFAGKIETAQKANLVLETALTFYPEEQQLLDSVEAVSDFVASIKISHWIELAEKAAFKAQYKRAISLYKDALFYLARENVTGLNKEEIAKNINGEIKKMRRLKAKN